MMILGLTGSIGMGNRPPQSCSRKPAFRFTMPMRPFTELYEGEAAPAIEAAFPGTTVDGKVDRNKLSAKVVHDPAAIKQLEQIVHPMLGASRQKFLRRCRAIRRAGRGGRYAVAVRDRRRETRRCGGGGDDHAGSSARANPGARQHDQRKARSPSWRGNCPTPKSASARDFVVDTSHGLDPVRAQIRDILTEAVKMPRRRS